MNKLTGIAACISVIMYGCSARSHEKIIAQADSLKPEIQLTASIPANELSHYKKMVSHFADSLFQPGRFNGSFLVAKDGQIIYEQYSGFRDPRKKHDSITPSTPFHLASISKTFTAMGILKLMEQGKLNIDDPVTKYIDSFPCEGVTIRTLLNHRSGIPNYVHYMYNLGWDQRKLVTNKDVLDFLIARKKDIHIGPPDKHFSYSNTNYALLALIIEKVSGLPYPDFMRLTFFEPLEMNDTYVYTMADSARSTGSFFYSGRPYAFDFLDLVYGDKNIYSTVRDLLKWDQALSNGQLFKKETLDEAYKGYSFERKGTHNYGLGWRMLLLPGSKRFIYHNGWWHGNRNAFYRLLDDHVAIIALCNNDYKRVYNVKNLADVFGNYFQEVRPSVEDEKENSVTKSAATPSSSGQL